MSQEHTRSTFFQLSMVHKTGCFKTSMSTTAVQFGESQHQITANSLKASNSRWKRRSIQCHNLLRSLDLSRSATGKQKISIMDNRRNKHLAEDLSVWIEITLVCDISGDVLPRFNDSKSCNRTCHPGFRRTFNKRLWR